MTYAEAIKELRKKLILTQTEFAELLGVSFQSINRWENGKHEPTIKIRRKIVEICKANNIDMVEKKNKNYQLD
jgi:transcriptional regulator with XRE-family HTH domain